MAYANFKAYEGKFINAKTDDNTINLTITGDYIKGLE